MLRSVDATAALGMDGVLAVLDASSIPGDNNCNIGYFAEHVLVPIGGKLEFHGQPVAVVVAMHARQAKAAAKAVAVAYDELPAVTSIRAAIEQESWFPHEQLLANPNGTEACSGGGKPDAALRALETDSSATVRFQGEYSTTHSKHFYMERQSAMAAPRPNEFGGGLGVELHCASQFPSKMQGRVATVLGVPSAWVTCKQHMVGGGFGGKGDRAHPVACAAALAAVCTNRAVRLVADISTDTRMNGGRESFHTLFPFPRPALLRNACTELLVESQRRSYRRRLAVRVQV